MNSWRPIGLILACALPLSLLLPLSPASAQAQATAASARKERSQPFLVVETRKGFASLQQAVDAIGEGRGTIRISPGTYHQCAVQRGGDISFVAAEAGRAIFEARLCEGKAALILRGRSARIDGAVFQHMRADESHLDAAPASAIALQAGTLSIVNSLFRNSDSALITADLPQATIHIREASFTRLGLCTPAAGCTSAVEIGQAAHLRVFSSAYGGSAGGSLLSSRAAAVDLDGNHFEEDRDAPPRAAMLSLPSGAVGRIRDTEFLLHHGARDAILTPAIAVAQRDQRNPSRGLVIDKNSASFAEGLHGSALFVANSSGEAVAVGDNHLGPGITAYQRPATPAAPAAQ